VSVTFTYDLPLAERLARAWEGYGKVLIGGPATGMRGEEFVPGRYVKHGAVITSRGCPNNCWFCSVPKREGALRELPITSGWNVLDDNLLACSEQHIMDVFAMLAMQDERPVFSGGLEATRLLGWHAKILKVIKTKRLFFAYDTPDDWEPLQRAADLMWQAGFTPASHRVWCYCLIGYPKDTMDAADERLRQIVSIGVTPFAMLWKDEHGHIDREWSKFRKGWVSHQARKARGVTV
jgi:hypothetical protein